MALPTEVTKTTRQERLYSAKEFMAMPLDPSFKYELVRGVIIAMPHPGGEHGLIVDKLHIVLGSFAMTKRLGRLIPGSLFELPVEPTNDTLRAPDLGFVRKEMLSTLDARAVKVIPDLAVEVYSPNDRPGKLRLKLVDYQTAGWNLVWVIYPPTASPKKKASTVEIYHLQESLEPLKSVAANEELKGEGVLAEFTMLVADLFDYSV